MESFESFAAPLRDDAHMFARNLTSNGDEADRLVGHGLREAFEKCRQVGPGATVVWRRCLVYKAMLAASFAHNELPETTP